MKPDMQLPLSTNPKKYLMSDLASSLEVIGPVHAAWILARRKVFSDTAYFRITEHWSLCCWKPECSPLSKLYGHPSGVAALVILGHYKIANLPSAAPEMFRAVAGAGNMNDAGYTSNSKTPFYGDDLQQTIRGSRNTNPKVYLDTFAISCKKMIGHIVNLPTAIRDNPAWTESDKDAATQGLEEVTLCLQTIVDILDSSPFQGAEPMYDIPLDCFVLPTGTGNSDRRLPEETGWLKESAEVGEAILVEDDRCK